MAETPRLADQTLTRLRQLAAGNGLLPENISVIAAEEATYQVEAQLVLIALFESEAASFSGQPRTRKAISQANFSALQQTLEQRRQQFQAGMDWVDDAIKELKKEKGFGWGHNGARLTLPQHCVTLAATENCPTCRGTSTLPCQECGGRRQIVCAQCGPYHNHGKEPCIYCNATGYLYNDPAQPCRNCEGTRFILCRECRGRMTVNCPSCQGHGELACTPCDGKGKFTQEISITAGAEINFQLAPNVELPTGLRRGMERIGLDKLPETYADIELLTPEAAPASATSATQKSPPPPNRLKLVAKIPYADLTVQLDQEQAKISVFGKKQRLFNVPPFLDASLTKARQDLRAAAAGKASLTELLSVRALQDSLQLRMAGKIKADDLRRLYPVGLSANAAAEIMSDMKKALAATTRATRVAATAGLSIIALLAIFLIVKLALPPIIQHDHAPQVWMIHGFTLFLLLGSFWICLNQIIRWLLRKKFKAENLAFNQNIGKIGYAALALLAAAYCALVALPIVL